VVKILRCDKVQKAPPPSAKGKKAKKDDQIVDEDLWEIEMNDTGLLLSSSLTIFQILKIVLPPVLFPEGGGQPSDTGSLVPLDASGSPIEAESAIVSSVFRRNLDAVHFVTKAFPVGSQVLARVNMERRTDLMSMHTAQHLLSAVLERDYELDTLSWSLQKFPESCYIELPRVPTPEEIEKVQARCNEVIQEKRRLRVRMELVSEETGVTLNEKAPEDYRDGERAPVQRTVIIDGIDENPFVFSFPISSVSAVAYLTRR